VHEYLDIHELARIVSLAPQHLKYVNLLLREPLINHLHLVIPAFQTGYFLFFSLLNIKQHSYLPDTG